MRTVLLFLILCFGATSDAQKNEKVSTIEFVQIVNDNKAEALYYFQNNWKVLRDMAIEKGYIHSYQLLETPYSDDQPFQIMLMTTYTNQRQFEAREEHFSELIEEKGPLKLMNDKEPGDFRRSLFSKQQVKHYN